MINFFAKTNFRNTEQVFGIKEDDRRRHMYVIGKTGMGKSNMLENMAVQDIRAGKGVCVVDPHGEFAEKMLRAVPSDRVNDVVYFNPADSEYPVAFNILEAVEEDKKNLVASGMMGVFKKIWPDVWSARMEYILNNTILALLDYPGSTMLGVNRMMSDSNFRKRVYPKIKDPVVKSFWLNEFDKWEDRFRKEAVAAIQNKVGQFLSSYVIRHIVGQPKSTIDMRDIMDNQKILIVNLSKGRIGEDAMRLLGGMVVTKIQLAAMSRVEIPEESRKDFYLYVDEFQNFATEAFANILSEARKYRLCLTLAHQYISQLIFDGNTTVRDAIFGNIGTLIAFRVGAEDAEHLEKEFDPVFLMNDLVNLAKYQIYLKLMIDGITGDAFSAITLPLADLSETSENEEKIIRVSRERYGKLREEVEERIARWSGIVIEAESQSNKTPPSSLKKTTMSNLAVPKPQFQPRETRAKISPAAASKLNPDMNTDPGSDSGADPAKKNQPMYEAVCDTCEDKILVPFRPDPTRPTFCKECLKDYQRSQARTSQERNEAVLRRNERPVQRSPKPLSEGREQVVAYVSNEAPISLSQVPHIAPKKFKTQRKNIPVDLEKIRQLIKNTKNKHAQN